MPVKRDPRDRGQKQNGSGGVRDMTIPTLRSGRVAKGKWVWGLAPLDYGGARALRTSDTDTLVGIFFYFYSTSSGRHPCLSYHISFGDDTFSVSSVYWVRARLASELCMFFDGHLKTSTLADGACEGPDGAGWIYNTLVVFSLRMDLMFVTCWDRSRWDVCRACVLRLIDADRQFGGGWRSSGGPCLTGEGRGLQHTATIVDLSDKVTGAAVHFPNRCLAHAHSGDGVRGGDRA